MPKYERVWSGLVAVGFLGFGLSKYLPTDVQQWGLNLGGVFLALGMIVVLAGSVAERHEYEEKNDNHRTQI